MKKTLSTILLGASLVFGAGNIKAQRENVKFFNHDEDEFSEELLGYRKEGIDEKTNSYIKTKMGSTIIYYSDKDNDNFHESIRIFNCDKIKRLVIEDFYIDKSTGLIDYNVKRYILTKNKWEKYYVGKPPLTISKEDAHENLYCIDKKFYPNLTEQGIYDLYQGFGERVKRLMNASKNEYDLKSMLKQERLRSELLK